MKGRSQPSELDDARLSDPDPRLAALLERYLADVERGAKPDPDALAAEYPESPELVKQYLATMNFILGAVESSAGAAPKEEWKQAPPKLGDYRIVREIARGGMGIVYEAEQISLGRQVALKILPFAAVLDARQLSRFKNEAHAAAQLHHTNIVPVFSVGCERGVHFYAMQYIDGQPLDRLIVQLRELCGELPGGTDGSAQTISSPAPNARPHAAEEQATRAECAADMSTVRLLSGEPSKHAHRTATYFHAIARLGVQAAEALEHAHGYGIVHRDIKPSNLMLDTTGNLWITDFGLARVQTDAGLTVTGELVGTLRYMSPEQLAGKPGLVDGRTDIYSLGVTLYELLTLRPIFSGTTHQEIMRQVESAPAAPRRLNPALPRDLETIILKAISTDKDDRYASGQELADDLRRFLAGKSTLARRPTLIETAGRWARRHTRVVAVAATILLVAMAGLLSSTVLIARQKAKTDVALAAARKSKQRAEQNFARAREVVDHFYTRGAVQLAAVPGAERLRRELLGEALGYYRRFVQEVQREPSIQADLAAAHMRIGEIAEELGSEREAATNYEQARRILASLPDDQRSDARRADLALCLNNLGLLNARQGNSPEAQRYLRLAIDRQRDLAAKSGAPSRYVSELASSLANLGHLYSETGRAHDAQTAYREAIDLERRMADRHPDEARFRGDLAATLNHLAFLESRTDLAAARQTYRAAAENQQKLARDFPEVLNYQSQLALTYNNLGSLESRAKQPAAARAYYQQAIAGLQQLVRKAPLVVGFARDLAVTHNNLGFLESQIGQSEDALRCFDSARVVFERLVRDYPTIVSHRSSLGGVHNNLGMTYEQLHKDSDAVAAYHKAVEHQRLALEAAPDLVYVREFLSKHYFNLARTLRATGKAKEAVEITLERKKLWKGTPGMLYEVAGELALAGAAQKTAADQHQALDAAMATLKEAIAAGYDDMSAARKDPAFVVLRDSPDYGPVFSQLTTLNKRTQTKSAQVVAREGAGG